MISNRPKRPRYKARGAGVQREEWETEREKEKEGQKSIGGGGERDNWRNRIGASPCHQYESPNKNERRNRKIGLAHVTAFFMAHGRFNGKSMDYFRCNVHAAKSLRHTHTQRTKRISSGRHCCRCHRTLTRIRVRRRRCR